MLPSAVQLICLLFMGVLCTFVCSPFIYVGQNQSGAVDMSKGRQNLENRPLQKEAPFVFAEEKISYVQNKKEDILFGSIIQQAADRYQVDPALVRAIIMAESGCNPKAVSKKGAKGLMQLMPKTAESLGVKDSFNPEDNINAGVYYFKKLKNQFNGNIELALAAYNAGSGKVKKYQGVPPFRATKYYIKKVLEYYQMYKEQMSSETGTT